MDIRDMAAIASLGINLAIGVGVLAIGKSAAETKNDMLRDAETRELRLNTRLDEMGNRFQDRLDRKVDKVGH